MGRPLAATVVDAAGVLAEAETFPDAIGVIVAPWRRLLGGHDFAKARGQEPMPDLTRPRPWREGALRPNG